MTWACSLIGSFSSMPTAMRSWTSMAAAMPVSWVPLTSKKNRIEAAMARLAVHVHAAAHVRHHEDEEGDARDRQRQGSRAEQHLEVDDERFEQVHRKRPRWVRCGQVGNHQAGDGADNGENQDDHADP